jgi:hypothetical protein
VKQQSSSDIDYSKPDLVFAQILATDEGRYVCKVMNGHGSSTSSAAVLQVYGKFAALYISGVSITFMAFTIRLDLQRDRLLLNWILT